MKRLSTADIKPFRFTIKPYRLFADLSDYGKIKAPKRRAQPKRPKLKLPPRFAVLTLRALETLHIETVLEKNKGSISQTARDLGMHRRALQRWVVRQRRKNKKKRR